MKHYTDEEIVKKLSEIWADRMGCVEKSTFAVERGNGYVDLTIQKMYESPGFSFRDLDALAQWFDSMNIETESEFGYQGCETCDYGSSYGFVLRVRDGDPYVRLANA